MRKIENTEKRALKDELEQKDRVIVLFYVTWCPFCQEFLPIFEEYTKSNSEECLTVTVDDKPDVCEEYSIEYYPTVIMFKKGKIHKRLDSELGVGLNKKQLKNFAEKP
jgi:thioredoxin 1